MNAIRSDEELGNLHSLYMSISGLGAGYVTRRT